MNLTRRALLHGGFVAAAWRLGPLRAETPASGPDGFVAFEAAPSRLALAPPPADPAATFSYAGSTPGPLLRAPHAERQRRVRRPDRVPARPQRERGPPLRPARLRLQSLPAP